MYSVHKIGMCLYIGRLTTLRAVLGLLAVCMYSNSYLYAWISHII